MTGVVRDFKSQASAAPRHAVWVRLSHWILAASVLTLVVSGIMILMVHPRLYGGEVGNDLTPALLELPISRNYRHGGWTASTPLTSEANGPVSAGRTYDIFNENGWARSLHFLAAWWLVVPGLVYVLFGFAHGHFRQRFWPARHELAPAALRRDLSDHLRLRTTMSEGPSPYGLLQKCAYAVVVFGLVPLIVLTGLAMSPAVTAPFPWLVGTFGGYQSARTIHFVAFAALTSFAVVHVFMVIATGFRRQMRAMTLGG
jgi:thiosulfate reductase cytochrome b subunit